MANTFWQNYLKEAPVIHRISSIHEEETDHGTEDTVYRAICGHEGLSWGGARTGPAPENARKYRKCYGH